MDSNSHDVNIKYLEGRLYEINIKIDKNIQEKEDLVFEFNNIIDLIIKERDEKRKKINIRN